MKLHRYSWFLVALHIFVLLTAGIYPHMARAELFISEYIEGSSFNKAIEIYNPGLVISEIMYNPASIEANWEWVEIYNASSSVVDLTGYVLDDINSLAHTAANIVGGSIPPGATAVLFNADDVTATDFEAAWGTGINLIPVSNWAAMALNNAGDTVSLWTDFASYSDDNATHFNALVTVPYGGAGDWPVDDGSSSIYLTDLAADATTGSNWALSANGVSAPTGSAYVSAAAGGNSGADVGSPGPGTGPEPTVARIHTVQGAGASTPLNGQTVTVEGVVTADYQRVDQLNGFFMQEEAADRDSNPMTSEGIFVYAPGATDVSEGDHVIVTGVAGEYFTNTQISASTVTIVSSGNPLPDVSSIDLPVPVMSSINDYYEPFEGMRVQFSDPLYVAEHFELSRYGQVVLTEGGRLPQFTSTNTPSVAGYAAHLEEFAHRQIILDDDNNRQNAAVPNGALFHPQPDGFGVGTQGVDFFRGGDLVTSMTGVLEYSSDAWRVRPTATNPVTFTVANSRPNLPDPLAGRLKVASFNVLNYFTGIDELTPICGPDGNQDCRGADSTAELTRQREKIVSALALLDADIVGLIEIENNASASLADLVDGLNTVFGAGTYAYINTGTIGTDAIKVGLIYKTATVSPTGPYALLTSAVDPDFLDTKNRPALAQSFVEGATGAKLTVVVNHLKSKGSPCDDVGDLDQNDGQGNCNVTRTRAAEALARWLATDPTGSGDPDALIVGDLNAYAMEDPISTLITAGYTDLIGKFEGAQAYSFLFDGQLGYLDHALANSTLTPQVTGMTMWHINADEVSIFDYNDDVQDFSEPTFAEEPDGNALYEPNVFRSSDHDPLVVGLDLVPPNDTDGDGVDDQIDNCNTITNPEQRDTDDDGFGNLCDGDLNNDGSTNTLDLNLYKQAHRSSLGDANYNPDADFNGDGVINTLDLNIYKGLHRQPPGPSCCGAF
jgi:predicted extracellular nuclease